MVLVHLYPKPISISQLADLAGYSARSKHVFKSKVLEALVQEGLVRVEKMGRNLSLVTLNPSNPLMVRFADICQTEGQELHKRFLGRLLEGQD